MMTGIDSALHMLGSFGVRGVRWVWRVCQSVVACGGGGTRSCFFEGGGGKGTRCLPFCDGILLFREKA